MTLRLLQRSRIAHASRVCLTVLTLAALAQSAHAKPLDKGACDTLQAEKLSLVVLGVDKEMAKGPEWAKAHLAPARLDMVRQLLIVNEQLKFRCPSPAAMAQANAKDTAAPVVAAPKAAFGKPAAATPAVLQVKPAAASASASAVPEAEDGVTVRAKSPGGAKAAQ
jgi:hypothetical protein